MSKLNLLGAAIPGQSLTNEPGSRPWEKPPQFVNEDEAIEYMLPRILNPQFGMRTAALMEKGMPATDITDTILKSGFAEGKWNPDLAALIGLPIFTAVLKSVEMTGKKPLSGLEGREDYETDEALVNVELDEIYGEEEEKESASLPKEYAPQGLMMRKNNNG